MTSLDRVVECRAATGLVELGLQIGLQSPGIQGEIQKAITKASLIAQNLPSLHLYRYRLTQLSSQLSLVSGNPKAAQNNLKRALAAFTQNDPPHVLYTAHLAFIASISSQSSDEATNTMRSLGAIGDLYDLASKRGHRPIIQLSSVLRLRALMRSGLWYEVGESLEAAEGVLGMEDTLKGYAQEKCKVPEDQDQPSKTLPSPSNSKYTLSTFEYALIVHTLILGIIFYTYVGDANLANPRLKWLHELLDMQLPRFPKTGIFEIPFTDAPSLHYQLTHPRAVYVLGFLVSSLAKRDLVGRKPKKKVFASEGIIAIDKELKKELAFPPWASISDVKEADYRLKKLRADLMCELIGASIMRSEFDEAERSIDETISYTRTQGIFSSYIARITLHEAQLAHALSKPKRALQCYQVATWLSRKRQHHEQWPPTYRHNDTQNGSSSTSPASAEGEEDPWINAAARAGELWLRIGLLRQTLPTEMSEEQREREMNELRKVGEVVTKDCRGLGGTLEAIAEVLDSCLTKEFVKAKTYLRRALNLSTTSQDNHLRALVLCQIASHYLHTSNQHAEKMLETAESLAAGLGTQPKQSKAQSPVKGGQSLHTNPQDAVGNAHMRLWVGERFLELHNRAENKEAARVQVVKNRRLKDAVARVEART
ncbi:hypothetical protein P691DRAFT_702735 [Macrolepiota fuliginosa MF-IS2]|uniref:Uncharacterized protein n=1 Tax=Macrolepiota fuliginosa MF-IS2 TaxID=1400762 RepID=A0A9P5XFG1_9AGAR|nr:hypothetical protein P691DRAFT_702735 [Macrolepiota fuliginosa MF-IS2]